MKMTTEAKMELGLFVGTMMLMVIALQPLL
jgi:hypothetical protein